MNVLQIAARPSSTGPVRGWPVRVVAALTAGYAIAMTMRPQMLARPCGMLDDDDTVPPPIAALTRSMGTRDAAMAVALMIAPTGRPMCALTAARVVCDSADIAYFGAVVSRQQRRKVAAFCGGWAILELGVQALTVHAFHGPSRARTGAGRRARHPQTSAATVAGGS